jgi:hypothetical protein
MTAIILGFFAATTANVWMVGRAEPAFAPATGLAWHNFSAHFTPLVALAYLIYAFAAYSVAFGVISIICMVFGAVGGGFISRDARVAVSLFSVPASLLAWVLIG